MSHSDVAVRRFAPSDAKAFDEFLRTHETSLLYHSSAYAGLIAEHLQAENATLVAWDGGGIAGVLPMLRLRTQHGSVYNSMPYYGSNGGVIASSEAARAALVREYRSILQERETIAGVVIGNPLDGGEVGDDIPRTFDDSRIGLLTELDGGDVLERIDSTARRNVQKAQRSNVEVFHDAAAFERLYELHVVNMTAIHAPPKTRSFFDAIGRHFRYGDDYRVYATRKNGRITAALLVFLFNRTVEYYTPAIDEEFRSDQPLSLLCVTAMRDAASRGFRWWNWGGTQVSQTGIYRFKKKWSTLERTYHYAIQMNRPDMLEWPGSRFREEFPGFYVVPFAALRQGSVA